MSDVSRNLVTRWQAGDEGAADELFQRYADRLIGLAQSRLSCKMRRRVDAEDVIQSACRSFFVGVREGRYNLEQGGDLWRLLVAITLNKIQDQVKRHKAGKRSIEADRGQPARHLPSAPGRSTITSGGRGPGRRG
jgi:RNA polymerase sigma-70 factor (ECF subfamily)